jgi:hypothetical protein
VDLVRLACPAWSLTGLLRLPLRWIWLLSLRARHGFHRFAAAGRVRPHPRPGVAKHQQPVHGFAVVHSGVGDVTAARQFVRAVHVHVVFGAVMALVRIPEHPSTHSDHVRPPVTRRRKAAFFGYQIWGVSSSILPVVLRMDAPSSSRR